MYMVIITILERKEESVQLLDALEVTILINWLDFWFYYQIFLFDSK